MGRLLMSLLRVDMPRSLVRDLAMPPSKDSHVA
jgi:hypothetical protein